MNIRPCKFCGKEVDFDEPWCDHETMEESAWLDIQARQREAIKVANLTMDKLIEETARELGFRAAETMKKLNDNEQPRGGNDAKEQ